LFNAFNEGEESSQTVANLLVEHIWASAKTSDRSYFATCPGRIGTSVFATFENSMFREQTLYRKRSCPSVSLPIHSS